MTDIRDWMYLSNDGPCLISTIYKEAKALLDASSRERGEDGDDGREGVVCWRPANEKKRLSRGAAILLGRMIHWLHGVSAGLASRQASV